MSTPPRLLAATLLLTRVLTLTLIGAFASVAGHLELLSFSEFQSWWVLTSAVAVAFTWLQAKASARYAFLVPIVEAVVALVIVVSAGAAAWPLVIYLVMTPVFVGVAAGGWLPVWVAGTQLLVLAVMWSADQSAWQGLPLHVLVRLALLGMLFGGAASLVRRSADSMLRRPRGYGQALALLEELSEVARELPSGLGSDAVAAEVQSSLRLELGAEAVAIFVPRGDRWAMEIGPAEADALVDDPAFLVGKGPGLRPLRTTTLAADNPWGAPGRVWLLPLRASDRLRAVAAVRYQTRGAPSQRPWDVRNLAEAAAAQLAAAEVYAEVRERATAEERRRVSREIHDGVAQDLAALTYGLDNIAADTGLKPVEDAANEVRRLVRELRLSIFDLRNDLDANEALGSAIGQYAQQVGGSTGIVVHTTVSERGAPLDAHLQHEMLRVCQEAVANARRHSRARNMWIVYRNHGQGWLLRVSDDGVGLADGRVRSDGSGGEGLSIMRERVARMGGTLTVRRRIGGGTVIEVVVLRGQPAPAASTQPWHASREDELVAR